MSLLSNLWGGLGGDGGKDHDGKAKGKSKGFSDDGKRSFAQVVSSESSGDSHTLKDTRRRLKDMQDGARLSGAKRPRSPNEATCGRLGRFSRSSLSIPLTPEIEKVRDDLASVAVLSLEQGHVNDSTLMEVAPSILNRTLAGPITPLTDCSFLVPLANREEVRDVCKLGNFTIVIKDGPCTLKLAPWSAEIGAVGRTSGSGQWMHLWNFPLHGWSWCTIAEVVKPVGVLVAFSQATTHYKQFLSVLVRRRVGVVLPFELDLSVGMRRYTVLITGE